MKAEKKKLCIASGCPNVAATRGLCDACYGTAGALVRAGKITWEELEKNKLAVEKKRKDSAFLIAFRKL